MNALQLEYKNSNISVVICTGESNDLDPVRDTVELFMDIFDAERKHLATITIGKKDDVDELIEYLQFMRKKISQDPPKVLNNLR